MTHVSVCITVRMRQAIVPDCALKIPGSGASSCILTPIYFVPDELEVMDRPLDTLDFVSGSDLANIVQPKDSMHMRKAPLLEKKKAITFRDLVVADPTDGVLIHVVLIKQ